MGIIKQEKKGGVTVYHVKKDITDAEMAKKKGSFFCTPKHVLKDDADVYTEEGDLLLLQNVKVFIPGKGYTSLGDLKIEIELDKNYKKKSEQGKPVE